jgi:hypothetical protein
VPSRQQVVRARAKAESPCRGPVRVRVQCARAQSAAAVPTHSLTQIRWVEVPVSAGSFLPSLCYQDPPVPVLPKCFFRANFVSSS